MYNYSQMNYYPCNKYQNLVYGNQYPMFVGTSRSNQIVNSFQQNLNAQTLPDTVSFKAREQIEAKSNKQGLSTSAKWAIGIGVIGSLVLAISLLAKAKFSQASDVVNNVNVKQELRQKFSEIFKKDFSEVETDKLVENYKQIFKIDDVDDFSQKMFEQIKKDSGNESKNIEFVIRKCKSGMAEGGGYTPQNRMLYLDIEHKNNIINHEQKKLIFESLVHEFQHVRQYEMAYNADSLKFAKAMTKNCDPIEAIAFLEDALKRKTTLISQLGGEKEVQEIIEKLKLNDPDSINLYCSRTSDEVIEIINNIKKSFGPVKQYDKNSENYKKGMKYLENFENYIQPTEKTREQYQQQIIEKEAFDAQFIAREILNLLKI